MNDDEKRKEDESLKNILSMTKNIEALAHCFNEFKRAGEGEKVMAEKIIFTLEGQDASMWRICKALVSLQTDKKDEKDLIPIVFKAGIALQCKRMLGMDIPIT